MLKGCENLYFCEMRDRFAVSFYGRSGNPSLRLQHSIGSVGLQRADIIRPYGLVFCTGCVGEAISFPLCQRDGKPVPYVLSEYKSQCMRFFGQSPQNDRNIAKAACHPETQ